MTRARPVCRTPAPGHSAHTEEKNMSKRARKRRDRKKNGANHGKKPNA
nr:hypothetical protein [Amycolatopsis benzoatilytica]